MARLDVLKEFLDQSPDDPFLHFAIAKEFEKGDNLDDALEKYRFLESTHPDYLGTYYHLGQLLIKLNHLPMAKEAIEKGIEVAIKQEDQHSKSELEGLLMELT